MLWLLLKIESIREEAEREKEANENKDNPWIFICISLVIPISVNISQTKYVLKLDKLHIQEGSN